MEEKSTDNGKYLGVRYLAEKIDRCLECNWLFDTDRDGGRGLCLRCQIIKSKHPVEMSKHGFICDAKIRKLIDMLNDFKYKPKTHVGIKARTLIFVPGLNMIMNKSNLIS